MSKHYENRRCSVLRYARDLRKAIKAKRLIVTACEGLLLSLLKQPARYPEWREALARESLKEIEDEVG